MVAPQRRATRGHVERGGVHRVHVFVPGPVPVRSPPREGVGRAGQEDGEGDALKTKPGELSAMSYPRVGHHEGRGRPVAPAASVCRAYASDEGAYVKYPRTAVNTGSGLHVNPTCIVRARNNPVCISAGSANYIQSIITTHKRGSSSRFESSAFKMRLHARLFIRGPVAGYFSNTPVQGALTAGRGAVASARNATHREPCRRWRPECAVSLQTPYSACMLAGESLLLLLVLLLLHPDQWGPVRGLAVHPGCRARLGCGGGCVSVIDRTDSWRLDSAVAAAAKTKQAPPAPSSSYSSTNGGFFIARFRWELERYGARWLACGEKKIQIKL